MLDIEKLIGSGELFDGHYKLLRSLSTAGATADVWTALDVNTMNDPSKVNELDGLSEEEAGEYGLVVAIKIYRPHNALDIEGEQRFRDEYTIVFTPTSSTPPTSPSSGKCPIWCSPTASSVRPNTL